jgi:hypothetical protein
MNPGKIMLFPQNFIRTLVLSLLVSSVATGVALGQAASTTPAPAPNQKSDPAQKSNSDTEPPPGSTPGLPTGLDPKTHAPYYTLIQEDWSSLDIGTSKLVAQPPIVAENFENESFHRQLIMVQWRPGDAFDLYVVMPKGVTKPPAVLYLYNYTEDTDRFKNEEWCQRVTAGGSAAVGFVSAMSGHRFHDRPMEQWFVSELQESLGTTVHDVKFIVDYLATRGDIDMDRIGMFGQSSGATVALLAAAADPRIKAVDALDPWGDWPNWLAKSDVISDDPHKDDYVKPEFLKKVANLDPVKYLPAMTNTQIRIQQVGDWGNPIETQDKIKEAAPKQAEVVRFATAMTLARREGGGILFQWIKDRLKGAPGADKNVNTMKASTTGTPPAASH